MEASETQPAETESEIRRLNWIAMNYYVRRGEYAAAAKCRDRVKSWNANGPI